MPNSARRAHSRESGFTLLEILVAFAILALSLGVIFQIYSKGTQATVLTRDYNTALMIAESQLAQLEVMDQLTPGTQQGTVMERFHWRATIQPYESDAPDQFRTAYGLFSLHLTVEWNALGKTRQIDLQTLKLAQKDG